MVNPEWDENDLLRIQNEMHVDPDVLFPVINAYNALLRGHPKEYKARIIEASMQAAFTGGSAEVELCRFYCENEISRHFGMEDETRLAVLNALHVGAIDPLIEED